ncbi:phosphoglycerate mutase family protein [Aliarcobacter butzleri]|uniref:Phosphoglycerate mutase family protein n=1 Tax=Aliarcobacter butzleri TaxID=28197 RepID=A0AAW7Q1H6_9BACT|nr:histidine phosphatase family protein [Aliarcobacter butzleri]MDN5113327.1 phosphoglycerate mutase family protein [Aliarcobacter butzleri]
MKTIYIIRHFKVKDTTNKRLNSNEFVHWIEEYDNFDLEYLNINLPKFDKIYVSSQNRAIKTANYLKLDYEISDLLVEVEAFAFTKTKLRFSKSFWLVISRILWFFNFTKNETKKDTKNRAMKFVSKIENEKNETILIISHGLYLKVLIGLLKKLGYKCNDDFNIKNGKLYKLNK